MDIGAIELFIVVLLQRGAFRSKGVWRLERGQDVCFLLVCDPGSGFGEPEFVGKAVGFHVGEEIIVGIGLKGEAALMSVNLVPE